MLSYSRGSRTAGIVAVSMAAALIIICSWISVPLTIPVTLQTFAVFTAAGLLGPKKATSSVLVYILLGAVGLPVFHGFTGGFGILLGTTGGYIIGFLFASAAVGLLVKYLGRTVPRLIISMTAGLLICYFFGTVWFLFVYIGSIGPVSLLTVLSWCVFPFIIPDMLKISAAAVVVNRLSKYLSR